MSSTPTLLIVMGTSGSGKSTVGSALSSALDCPFVDGDDLHPASNVDKMSKGQPLNDADREPWLIKIRRTGLELATSQKRPTVEQGEQGVKQMAEVYETSHAATTSLDDAAANTAQDPPPQKQTGSTSHIAIIACSSLKLVYRRLLRGSITSLSDPNALQPELAEPKDLKVIHIYLDLSRQLLEERMRNRKGHFMKLDMLYSQLDTLQVPDPEAEPGVVSVQVQRETTTEEIVRDAVAQLKSRGLIDA